MATTPMPIICHHGQPISKCNECNRSPNGEPVRKTPPRKETPNTPSFKRKILDTAAGEITASQKKSKNVLRSSDDILVDMSREDEPIVSNTLSKALFASNPDIVEEKDPITSTPDVNPPKVLASDIFSLIIPEKEHFVSYVMDRLDKIGPNNRKTKIKLAYTAVAKLRRIYTSIFKIKAVFVDDYGRGTISLTYDDIYSIRFNGNVTCENSNYPLSKERREEMKASIGKRCDHMFKPVNNRLVIFMPSILRGMYSCKSEKERGKYSVSDLVIANVLDTINRITPFKETFDIEIGDIIRDHSLLKRAKCLKKWEGLDNRLCGYLCDIGALSQATLMCSVFDPKSQYASIGSWSHFLVTLYDYIRTIAKE